MKPEVVMGKNDAPPRVQARRVKLMIEHSATAACLAKDLGVHENVLREWVRGLREALIEALSWLWLADSQRHGDSQTAQGSSRVQDEA